MCHLLRFGALGLPKEYDLWCAMKEATKSKVPTLLIIYRFLPLKVNIPVTFSSANYYCIVIAKHFLIQFKVLWLPCLLQDVDTYYVNPKTNTIPFELTRQDKISHGANIPEYTAAGQLGWSSGVAETYLRPRTTLAKVLFEMWSYIISIYHAVPFMWHSRCRKLICHNFLTGHNKAILRNSPQ